MSDGLKEPEQQTTYDDNRREDVLPFLPRDATSALDIGCGKGGFGLTLRNLLGPDARIFGIEATAEQARYAAHGHGFDEVFTGYFPDELPAYATNFDLVTFNDVLEHVYDPWDVLRRVHDVLSPQGRVVAAIPNVQYAQNIWRLIRGRWDYAESGLLDRTHIRFFTRATMIEMFEGAGFAVESVHGANHINAMENWDGWRRHLMNRCGNAQWLHFVVTGTSKQ